MPIGPCRTVALLLCALILAGGVSASLAATQATPPSYGYVVTSGNRVGLTITNYGFFGNSLATRQASFEYPNGSGFENLVRGGLWVGARVLPGGSDTTAAQVTHVTTGCVDNYYYSSPTGGSEFTPDSVKIELRSTLPHNVNYNRKAVSENDVIARFNDLTARSVTGAEPHIPLGLDVRVEAYSWSFELADAFVVLHCTVKNTGPLLRDVWLGMYTQLVSQDKKPYTSWPPNTLPGRPWFYHTMLDYVDSLKLVEERYCVSSGACNSESVTPVWAGLKYLGTHTNAPRALPHFKWWVWDPNSDLRSGDQLRYGILSDTSNGLPTSNINVGTDSPVEIMNLGPFPILETDSTITADFAFVAGIGRPGLESHARFAQTAFDLNYVLPTPPPSPALRLVAHANSLDYYWNSFPDTTVDSTSLRADKHDFEGYRVYLGDDPNNLHLIVQNDLQDDIPPNTDLTKWRLAEPVSFPGDTTTYVYHYHLDGLRDGFHYYASVTAFDKGDARVPSLEGGVTQNLTAAVVGPTGAEAGRGVTVFPNPYKVEARWDAGTINPLNHYLWFLGLPAKARVRIFTLGGDLVKSFDFDAATYTGQGSPGVYDPTNTGGLGPPTLSGSMAAWNLISDHNQAVASGMYLYSVEDIKTGKRQVGKFVVIKADRSSGF